VIPPADSDPYVRRMLLRLFSLAALLASLVAIDPHWITIDWTAPLEWLSSSRPEDALAAIVRTVAIALAASQTGAVTILWTAHALDSGTLERVGRRILVPVLRSAAPIALVAGSALPATASETRLPITPPAARVVAEEILYEPEVVVVRAGDSLWKIAAAHAPGEPAPFWLRVVDLNRTRFADVNLIQPGDEVLLPTVNPAG
jgi:nucleoid-associated protein YgaU